MIRVMLSQLCSVLNARLIGEDRAVSAVSTDSRVIPAEALFVALVGERFDAHDFASQAVTGGAIALLVQRELDAECSQLVVADTKQALGQLGSWCMRSVKRLRSRSPEAVAKPRSKRWWPAF